MKIIFFCLSFVCLRSKVDSLLLLTKYSCKTMEKCLAPTKCNYRKNYKLYATKMLLKRSHLTTRETFRKGGGYTHPFPLTILAVSCAPMVQPWSTLVEGGKERYRPPGKLTLELVLANQNKINFYVYGLCSLPSGPIRFLTSFC